MGAILPIDEIWTNYAGEWVLIGAPELDDELNVIRGEVLAHSFDRDEVYEALRSLQPSVAAIEYTGTIPEDMAFAL